MSFPFPTYQRLHLPCYGIYMKTGVSNGTSQADMVTPVQETAHTAGWIFLLLWPSARHKYIAEKRRSQNSKYHIYLLTFFHFQGVITNISYVLFHPLRLRFSFFLWWWFAIFSLLLLNHQTFTTGRHCRPNNCDLISMPISFRYVVGLDANMR